MRFSFILNLAFRNLMIHKLRFAFTLLATALAVGAIVFLLSLTYGLEKISTQELVAVDSLSQIEVTPAARSLNLDESLVSQIKNFPETGQVEFSSSAGGKLRFGNLSLDSVIYGVSEGYLSLLQPETSAGALPKKGEKDFLLISEKVVSAFSQTPSSFLGEKLGFDLILPAPLTGKEKKTIEGLQGSVSGVIKNDKAAFVYVPADIFRQGEATTFSTLRVKATTKDKVPILRKKLENLGLRTTYIGDTLEEINRFFSYFRVVLAIFGTIGILIAVLGMFNTLSVSLLERVREVALLKILGTSDKNIFFLFAFEALIFGLLGYFLGIILAFLGEGLTTWFLTALARRLGNESMNIFSTPPLLLVIVFFATLLVAFLTGLFPARRSVKTNPLDVQRYE